MTKEIDDRLEDVIKESAMLADAIRYRFLRSARGEYFLAFIAPYVGRGKRFDMALDKQMTEQGGDKP